MHGDHLAHVALTSESIEIPKIDILSDQTFRSNPSGRFTDFAQLACQVGMREVFTRCIELFGIEHQSVGGLKGRLKFRRLQILVPLLIVIIPLRQVIGETFGALESKPEEPSRSYDGVRVMHFNCQRVNPFGPVEW